MGSLTVRNLNDNVIEALKVHAKANHRSLEAEVRYLLTQRVDRHIRIQDFRERTLRLTRTTPDVPQTDSVELLREDRDR